MMPSPKKEKFKGKILSALAGFISNFIVLVSRGELIKKFFWHFREKLEQKGEDYLTVHTRPKKAEAVGLWSDDIKAFKKNGLVLQGPVITEDDFTLETIRLYKKTFDHSVIILSTWSDEKKEVLSRFEDEGIIVLLNEKPGIPGYGNINYQIVSSSAGMLKAKELDADYVLKTRTDQRIYAPNVENYLWQLLDVFPVAPGYPQKKRILGVSLNSFKYRPYALSDMTLFGDIEDMLLFWGVKLDDRPFVLRKDTTMQDWVRLKVAEGYLVTKFLAKLGRPTDWTVQNSWQMFAEHFCVIDQTSLDLYWPKYDRQREYRYWDYEGIRTCQALTFRDWLNLYKSWHTIGRVPEGVLEMSFSDIVAKEPSS
ncbi:MAG: hypothetical protein JW893_05635 [Candidatus Omnitrophica bacterium]|nr:hypothetical protein [Candidatus Omnitrophota bacterium]